MTNTACFSRDELRSYLFGDMPEAAAGEVASHVETCQSCEATVTQLDLESDTLIESLREPIAQAEPAAAYRLAAKRAVSHLRSLMAEPAVDDSHEHVSNAPRLRDYELLEPLARGGMGTVYRARHLRLNRQVALKVLPGRLLQNPGVVARFEREMQAVGSLRHPAIVQATDGGEAEGVHFLVMELIDGVDGSTLVQHLGPLPVADACEIARQAAVGMAYVHEQGIIHRDLKPSNLMVTSTGEVKVLDLGLARIVGEQLAEDELTTVGQLMGTLDFMAPEQVENSHEADERADIYSLGATLYKLLTGRAPHTTEAGEPLLSKLRRIASEPPMPLHERQPDLPVELCELVDRTLSNRADDRPASMNLVADSLAAFCTSNDLAKCVAEAASRREQLERSSVARSPGKPSAWEGKGGATQDSHARPASGRRVLAWAAGALLLLVAVMGVVITLQTSAGQLVIETSTPDVEVRVMKAGQPYRQLTLKQTAESLRLGAGEYEIEIVSGADGLEIENGSYTLKRGETWLARIVHREAANVTLAASDEPTYEGKTLKQWLALLRTERSPQQFYDACQALAKLGTGDNEGPAVAALLAALSIHDRKTQAKGYPLWEELSELLQIRTQAAVIAACEEELERNEANSTDFILDYLRISHENGQQIASPRLLAHVERLTSDGNAARRIKSLGLLGAIGSQVVATRRLVAALSDREFDVQLFAARTLIEMRSNTPLVVSTLRQIVGSGELRHRAEAAWLLGDLGTAAKTALPELTAIVQDDDDAISRQAAYHPPTINPTGGGFGRDLGMTSVKDAAIRALAEIGDTSVEPILNTEWKRRVSDASSSNKSTATWKSFQGRLMANTYNADWVADAIEQLIGMRPNSEKLGQASVTTWTARGLSLNTAYSIVFGNRQDSSLPHALDAAKQLMPRARDTEIEQARNCIHTENVLPPKRPDELELEVKLITLLATADEPIGVLKAMFARWDYYAGISAEKWEPGVRSAALDAYRQCAVQILRATEDWQTALVPGLLQLADDRVWPAGVVLTDVLPELDASQQVEGVVYTLQLIAVYGPSEFTDFIKFTAMWLEDDSHRDTIQRQLDQTTSDAWEDFVVGLLRTRLADDDVLPMLKTRFGDDSIDRAAILKKLIRSLYSRSDLAQVVIDLLEHPALDTPATVTVRGGERTETSLRAAIYLKELTAVQSHYRGGFMPLLQKLVQSGKNGESEAARQVLEAWK